VIGGEAAGWILSALFAATALWSLGSVAGDLRSRRHGSGERAASSGLHLLMCAGMISMFWSWGTGIPPIGFAAVFTGAAAWFAGRAMFAPVAGAGIAAALPGSGTAHLSNWYQAAMMAAMVWMAVAVSVPAVVPSQPSAAGQVSMPGMTMGMGALSGGGGAAPARWVTGICLAAGLALAAAAAWHGTALVHRVRAAAQAPSGFRGVVTHDTAVAVATAGMAAALLMMA
jgi:hypothetical protein